jgi:hypothetical protein
LRKQIPIADTELPKALRHLVELERPEAKPDREGDRPQKGKAKLRK